MRDYDPSADPYGWVGDPSAASDDQAKLLATMVDEVRPLPTDDPTEVRLAAAMDRLRETPKYQNAIPVIGHCFHCKEKREIVDSTVTFNKTGVPITQGKCSTCGGAISRLGRMK